MPVKGIRSGKMRSRTCFVYIMHEDRKIGIPTGTYVTTVLDGYDAFHFDERYLANAIQNAKEAVDHEGRYHDYWF